MTEQLALMIGTRAELAALLVPEKRPALADGADLGYLEAADTWLGATFRQLVNIAGR